MARPRTLDLSLPQRVHYRHGAYYYVHEGKWTNLGRDRATALARVPNVPRVPKAEPVSLEKFMASRFAMLKARPQSRTGRLKAVTVDLAYVTKLAADNRWRCAVTGIPMTLEVVKGRKPYAPSIDRIDCAADYVPGNIRIVCVAANLAMNVWGEEVLLRLTRGIVARRDKSIGQAVQVQLDSPRNS